MANIEIFGTLVRNDGGTNRDKIVQGSQVEGGYFVCETLPTQGTWATGQLCYCQADGLFYIYTKDPDDSTKLIWIEKEFGITSEAVASESGTGGAAGLMSATDKEKLDGIKAGAQVNTIEAITVNDKNYEDENSLITFNENAKTVNIKIPTTVAELSDAEDYVTNDTLSDYATAETIENNYVAKGSIADLGDILDTDIKLSAPFNITKDFGYYKASDKTCGKKDQTLRAFLQGALAEEDFTIWESEPSLSITISGSTSGEVGTTVTPTAKWSYTTGTYKHGCLVNGEGEPNYNNKTTGITYSSSGITKAESGSDVNLGNQIKYSDSTQILKVQGTITRSAVKNHPISNLGTPMFDADTKNPPRYTPLNDEYKTAKEYKDVTRSQSFTGYRKMFILCLTQKVENFDSDIIRTAKNGADKIGSVVLDMKATTTIQEFDVPAGTKQIVIAYPAALNGNSQKKPTLEYTSLGQTFTEQSTNIVQHHSTSSSKYPTDYPSYANRTITGTILVKGANSYAGVPYYIYSYTHEGTFGSKTPYSVKI